MRILLDTCTFLWLALDPGKLSPAAVRTINDPASELHFSDISLWEIVLKHTAGKLPLPEAPDLWLPPQLTHWQLRPLPITRPAIFRSGTLPAIHSDPFDRLLASTAIDSTLTILSPDTPLSDLGAARLW